MLRKLATAAALSTALLAPATAHAQPGIDPQDHLKPSGTRGGVTNIPGCESDDVPDIESATAQIAPSPTGHWDFAMESNYNHCRNLSNAAVTADINDPNAADQLLLFHHGQFIGTGIDHAVPHQNVLDADDDSVTVAYDVLGSDGNLMPGTQVTYRWIDDHVEMEGELPAQYR